MRTYPQLETVLLIAIGGFAGSNLRYFVELVVPNGLAATLLVNVVGSFALGVILYESIRIGAGSERARLVLGTGFLSSFTTFSTFVVDAVRAEPIAAVAYVGASYGFGIAAVMIARTVVDRTFGGA